MPAAVALSLEPDRRTAGVEEKELHQERRAAEKLDEHPDERS